jgi:hypothetical protein
MAIVAPFARFRRNNLILYIVVCLALAAWCAYDGYYNEDWIKDHTDAEGNPEFYLTFNRRAPAVLIALVVLFGGYLLVVRNGKIIAEQNELVLSAKEKIPYDSIQKIDKTHFKSKDFFVVTYKDDNGREVDRKLSGRKHDNLQAVLDELVEKIS